MVQFVGNYNKNIDTAECYIDIEDNTSENNFSIVFLEPNIIFGDKKAIFSLPNYTLDYRYGFNDVELMHIVKYIKKNEDKIYDKLDIGIEKYNGKEI